MDPGDTYGPSTVVPSTPLTPRSGTRNGQRVVWWLDLGYGASYDWDRTGRNPRVIQRLRLLFDVARADEHLSHAFLFHLDRLVDLLLSSMHDRVGAGPGLRGIPPTPSPVRTLIAWVQGQDGDSDGDRHSGT